MPSRKRPIDAVEQQRIAGVALDVVLIVGDRLERRRALAAGEVG